MRNYWLRIAVGAFAIFGVGMLLFSMIERGKREVVRVVHSDEPLTIPLAFIPFTVDGKALGTLRRVQLVRSTPERVSAIKFRVKLADSVDDARLATCVLVAGEAIQNVEQEQAFSCVPAADTAGRALEPIGEIETQRGATYVLLGQAGTLESIHLDFAATQDSIAQAAEATADSIEAAHEAMADSIEQAVDSAMREAEPRMREQMRQAMEKARKARVQAAEDRARARGATPVPPEPPAPRP